MELPYSDQLRVDQAKIVDYLLSESNGRGKATFFLQFGFRPEQWAVLAEAIKVQARGHTVVLTVDSPWGTRYSVEGPIDTPSGRQPRPRVRTVWILEVGSERPRLITAHPV